MTAQEISESIQWVGSPLSMATCDVGYVHAELMRVAKEFFGPINTQFNPRIKKAWVLNLIDIRGMAFENERPFCSVLIWDVRADAAMREAARIIGWAAASEFCTDEKHT